MPEYPFEIVVGDEWAWEAAFITVIFRPALTRSGEAAVRAGIDDWWRTGSSVGFGGHHVHDAAEPTFHSSSETTTLRMVVDFASAGEAAFDQLARTIKGQAATDGSHVREILLNVEPANLFDADTGLRPPPERRERQPSPPAN